VTVFIDITPTLRGWSGFAEPSLPIGIWTAAATVLGDASGGSRTGTVVFKTDNTPPVARLWNLEQFDAFDEDATPLAGDLIWNGWDLLPGATSEGSGVHGGVGIGVAFQASPIAGAVVSSLSLALYGALPILLGVPAATVSSTTLQFRVANSDGLNLRMRFQGYVWSNRAFQVPGGPQRPATSLWR